MAGHERDARAHENGPDRELTALVETTGERLLHTAYLLCLDLDLAEDLVVRTWTEVARRWSRRAPAGARSDRPEAWALRTLVTVAVRAQEAGSARHRPPEHSPSLVGRRGAPVLQQVEDQLEVEFALTALDPRERAILVLRYHEGLTDQETAEALGCPVSLVRCTTHHAVHRGEAAAELLSETFAWQASAVDADRVDAVISRDYEVRAPALRLVVDRAGHRWPGRGWLATAIAGRRGHRR